MSKKYVPSFLKDQPSSNTTTVESTRSFNTNKFAPLADDFTKREKPIINTSRPAMEAPKLAPATLASLTSNSAVAQGVSNSGGVGSKKSFASKFAEQAKIASDPNYKPPPKPIDFGSEDDFPSLGSMKKSESGTSIASKTSSTSGSKFADLAKGWAKQKEEEAETERIRRAQEEQREREASLMRSVNIGMMRRRHNDEYQDEEDEYNNYDESSLGDDDSYEVPEGDDESSEEDEEDNDEFNQNVGWDGRRKDDLY